MYKICLLAAFLAIAGSSPVPEANPGPKAEPKPDFLAAYYEPVVAAPGIAYAAPLAYSSYVAPVYAEAYPYYYPYASSYVVV